MRRFHLLTPLLFVLAAFAFLPSLQAAATNVTACQVINVAGMYQFNQTVNGSSNACIDISASDVDLDCRGNLLFGNLTANSIGIRAGPANNVTLYNCQIKNFSQGITVRTSSNVSIWNNSLWNNTAIGILLENQGGGHGNSTHVFNNTVSYSEYNIKSAEFDDSEFYNNRIYNASAYAMLLQSGTRNNVTNNTVWNNTGFGIRTDTNENVTYLFNNTFYNNSAGGIYLVGSIGSRVYSNTLYNNTGYGIFLQSGLNANVSYNAVYNQSSTGIRADTYENASEINYNTVYTNYGGGILVSTAYLTNLRFNTVYNNSQIGIYLLSSTYANVTNNTVHNSSTTGQPGIRGDGTGLNYSRIETNDLYGTGGIGILDSSTNTTVRDNTILQSTGSGVFLQAYAQNITVFKNTITNFTSTGIIVFDYSHDNYVLNNTLTNASNTDGIQISTQAHHNYVQYNNLTFVYYGTGITLFNATDNSVSYNRVINSTNLGISLLPYSYRNTLLQNTVVNTTSDAISVWGLSGNNTVRQNTVSFVYSFAIRFENSSDNNATSNTIFNTSNYGMGIGVYAMRNRFESNTVENYSVSKGISIYSGASDNVVYLNNLTFGYSAQGIDLNNASNNNVSYNRVSNASATGIQLVTRATGNTVADNIVTAATGASIYAVYVSNSSFNSILRNSGNYSSGGFQLTTSSHNNTLENNSIYFTPGYGFLVESSSSNNTLRGNTVVNHSADAIRLDTFAADNYVLNNTLINGTNSGPITGYGIRLAGAATRNFVDYNNVSFDQASGLVLSNATYNTLRYNRFFNTTIQTAYLDSLSSYNTLLGNLFENASHRIFELSNASFNTVENNTFRYGQKVQLTLNATNNTFFNNTLEFLEANALELNLQSHNNSFRENDLLNNTGHAIFIDRYSLDNYFYSNLVSNVTGRAVHVESSGKAWFFGDTFRDAGGSQNELFMILNSTEVNFTNATISSSLDISHFLLNRSSVVLLNVTFNKSRVSLVDSLSNVTYRWYVRVNVTDRDGVAVASSDVSIRNTTTLNESLVNYSQVSAADGLSAFVPVTEAFITNAATNNVSSYNFSASRIAGAYSNATLFNVTQSGSVVVQVNVPPVVVLSSPFDGRFNRSRAIIFRYVPSDSDNVTFLNCSVWTNETAWSVKSTNASSITNGSNNSITVSFSADGFYRWNVGCFDKAGEGALSSVNYTVRVDNTTPAGFGYVSPTLVDGSVSVLNYSEVNVTFTEDNPDSCLLEFNNGTAVNYSMSRSGDSCFGNVSISNTGDFNYSVWVNDSAGSWNNSGRRFVTLSDDATAPVVVLSSPGDSAALSSLSSLVFSFNDLISATASCTVFVDGASVYSNASVLNGTSTSAAVSVSSGVHSWNASCTDGASNQGNSSVFSFSLSSGGGSGTPSAMPVAVVPSATPSVAPVSSVVPSVVPVSSVEPSVVPVVSEAPVEEVVVPVEEVSSSTEPVVLQSGGSSGEGVIVTTSFSVSRVVVPSGGSRSVSRVLVETRNVGALALEDLQVTREFKFLECLGSDPAAYEAVGVVFSPRPYRIECGSAVVTWLFENVEPGETVTAEAKVPGELSREQVVQGVTTPRVVARAVQVAKVTATPVVSVVPSVVPTPGGFDWTLPALGVLVLLGVGAFFVFGRKPQGL